MFHMWDISAGADWRMAFGGFWMALFGGGLIALVVWGITKLTKQSDSASKRDPLDVAKERYARGEISREEFEQIKKDLSWLSV